MVSRKRTHGMFEDDDDDLEIDNASSSLRQNVQKRPRAVLAAENGGSTVSDEEDETPENTSRQGSNMPDDTPMYSDVEEDEDVAELRSTQYIQRQMAKQNRHGDNREMDSGIIEEVYCRNFMCHAKLRIKLGPLINFVIGHNGSGKSAVLTALTMCLGGKATATSRGTSMKSMIKEGEETATLAVKIKNQGDSAYRPDIYGQSITVERHFNRSGTGSFKIKNAQDRIISTKKAELDDIIDYFGLQLDNPINVLNQDMARQFLSNSSAADKYKFFIRGTQLETLDTDYKLLEEQLEGVHARLTSRDDDILILKQRAKEAEDRKKRLDLSESIRTEIQRITRMHAWAQVEEEERNLAKCKEQIEIAQANHVDAEQAAVTAGGVYEGAQQAHERAQQRIDEIEKELEPTAAKHNEEHELFNIGTKKLMDMQADKRKARGDLDTLRKKRDNLQQQIQDEQALLADANGVEHAQRLERKQELREEHEQALEDRTNHEELLPGLRQANMDAESALTAARTPVNQCRGASEREVEALRQMRSTQDRRLASYRRDTNRLIQAVDNAGGWRSKPVGPVGIHLKLKDSQWMSLIEKHLNGIIESWIVTCREDQIKLSNIMKSVGCTPSILIGNHDRLNTAGKEPSEDLVTILRVLDIDNDLVRNQLIIQQAIEQVVLIRDRRDANAFMNHSARPPNVKAALTFVDDGYAGIKYDYSRSGAARSAPIPAWSGPSRMQTNREAEIARQEEVVARAQRDFDRAQQEFRQMQREVETTKKNIEKHKRARTTKATAVQEIEEQIDALVEEIDKNRPQDGRLQELERQLNEATEGAESQKNIVADLVAQQAMIDEDQKEIKARLDAATAERDDHVARLEKARTHCTRLDDKRTTALRAKNEAIQSIEDRKREVQHRIERYDEQSKIVNEDFIPNAEKISLRVPVDDGMTCTKLDAQLERLGLDIQRAERDAGGNREEVTEAWRAAQVELKQAQDELRDIKDLQFRLKKSLHDRRTRWKYFRSHITARARSMFMYLLKERQFRGHLLLDHHDKLLNLSVEPDHARASDSGREARTLSGGEKSFSTICLLLSIWDAMGSPIRCLDEFDVFMDSANRASSMTMMIKAARRATGRQFILITPQSMQDVELGDDVKIHKMSDPERGQQALPFTQG